MGKWVWGPHTVGMGFGMFIPPKNNTLGGKRVWPGPPLPLEGLAFGCPLHRVLWGLGLG